MRKTLLLLCALVPSWALAQVVIIGPALTFKAPASLQGASIGAVTVEPRVVNFELGRSSFLSVPGNSAVPAPAGLAAITIPLDLAEVPDGGIYIVELGKKDDHLRFRSVARDSHRPSKVSIVFRPSDLKLARKGDGSVMFTLPKPLRKGQYAIAITNNQYAWPFEVR